MHLQTTEKIIETAEEPLTFRQAKIEHYLQRTEDHLQMARYTTALRTLRTVYQLDSENSAARSLQKRITYYISSLMPGKSQDGGGRGKGFSVANKHRRNELVLLVDQDERVLTSLTSTLRKYGFRAVGASCYDEAIEAVSTYKPDLVVSEVNFENGSVGYDLYLWIRTTVETQEMPFLFLATRIDRDMLIAGKRLGVADFILKPLDDDLVIASILNCLARIKKSV
jgi:PleD family two-component response regulator